MARRYLTGDDAIEAMLKDLAEKEADRIAKSVLGAGLTVISKQMRKDAPKGPTGNLKKSIGKRLERGKRGGNFTAKAGINVGKRKRSRADAKGPETVSGVNVRPTAPHAHLVGLGTGPRRRRAIGGSYGGRIKDPTPQQLSTGSMPANPFIREAYRKSQGAMQAAMRKRAVKALERAAAKARKR
jgi:HK97 gp10 family phage protein